MDLRGLLKLPYEEWPKDDYEGQQAAFPEGFRALMADGRMHDMLFESLQYLNPSDQCWTNPTLVITLSDGERHELIFPHVLALEITTPEPLEPYYAEFEHVMSTSAQFADGRYELAMQFASGWGIYVKSAGIDARKES